MGKWGERIGLCCGFCWAEFKVRPSSRHQQYCSAECNGASRRKHRICEYCGEDFKAKRGDHNTYCSRECAFADKEAVRLWRLMFRYEPPKRCRVCYSGSLSGKHVTCSEECACVYQNMMNRLYYADDVEASRERHREYYWAKAVVTTLNCPECGQEFEQSHHKDHGPLRTYCSEGCANRVTRRNRKMRKREAWVEDVYLDVLVRRDGGRCGVCGGKVDQRCNTPHPKAPVIDHIVPLARGGLHSYRNTQVAHFMCNSVKGAGAAGSQLRLLG